MTGITITRTLTSRPVAASVQGATDRFGEYVLGAVRIVVGFLFACHGAQKLFGILGKSAAPIGAWPSWWAGLIEFVAGTLIVLGLFTRASAVLCSGTMAYAYFTVHQAAGALPVQNKGELAALYSWVFLMIAIVGPGAMALDAVRSRRATRTGLA